MKIECYKKFPQPRGGAVNFIVKNQHGQMQSVAFRLSLEILRNGELLKFAKAVLPSFEHVGNLYKASQTSVFKELVGKRLDVYVIKQPNGKRKVLDYRACSNNS